MKIYNVIIDQKDISKYKDVTQFMEKGIEKADVILTICTPTYKQKADERTEGVGYEARIISYEIYEGAKEKGKMFIPILRKRIPEESLPNYLKGYEYVDFRQDERFESKIKKLIEKINKKRRYHDEERTQKKGVYHTWSIWTSKRKLVSVAQKRTRKERSRSVCAKVPDTRRTNFR